MAVWLALESFLVMVFDSHSVTLPQTSQGIHSQMGATNGMRVVKVSRKLLQAVRVSATPLLVRSPRLPHND